MTQKNHQTNPAHHRSNGSGESAKKKPQFHVWVVGGILWAMAFVLEGGALLSTYRAISDAPQGDVLSLAILLHLAAAFCLFCVPVLNFGYRAGSVRFYAHLTAWLTLFLPAIGLAGCSLTFFWVKMFLKEKGIVEDHMQFTDYAIEESQSPYSGGNPQVFLQDALSVEPIMDILAGNDEDLKRGAVDLLGRIATPEAIHLLRECLTNPSADCRFYAHTTLARLDETHARKIKEAQELVASRKGGEAEDLRHLGNVYRDYGESGLIEDETRDHYLKLARDAFSKSLAKNPQDQGIPAILGELNVAVEDYGEAERFFRQALKGTANPVEPLLGLCRIYYEKRDLKSLAKIVERIQQGKIIKTGDLQKDTLFQFWAQPLETRESRV